MTGYLLDTHAFVWLKAARARISPATLILLADPDAVLLFSAASAIELFDKFSKGGDTGINPWLESGAAALSSLLLESGIDFLPISIVHAAATVRLPLYNRDPFDRLLIAQAFSENLTLVSRDASFGRYPGLKLLKA